MNSATNKKLLYLGFVMLIAWLFTYYEALKHMIHVWSSSEAYKHCFFIPVIVVYLIYEKKSELKAESIRSVPWLLFPLLLIQLAYVIFAELSINLLMHGSAYLTFVVLVWFLIGHKLTKIIAFPLLYLGFCVPFGAELVPFLQDVTADLSVGMLRLVDIPVYRDGLYIYLSNGTFHVAEACAGVRFLIGTFAIGVLLAYLNYQKLWKRLAFISFCAVIPILANGVRAFGIMVIGYLSDMKYATGADHLIYGWFFFAFVTIIIFLVGMIANDKLAEPRILTPSHKNVKSITSIPYVASIVILIAPVFAWHYLLSDDNQTLSTSRLIHLEKFPKWERSADHKWAATTDDETWFGVSNDINIRLVYVNEAAADRDLVSSRHRIFDNENWTQKKLETKSIGGIQVDIADVVNIHGQGKTLAAWYAIQGFQSSNKLKVKAYQLINKLHGETANGFYVVVEVSQPSDVENISKELDLILQQGVDE
ncbi:exosortase A [Alteromonas sp. MTD1]|uniref:exosortase A n=1 Tax=Alteromonas sp. MTD1 TaxID=3057962 RepID=UPI0036F3FF9F